MIGMETIGLIGGLSWYSTAEYYRLINELVQEAQGGHASARIALQSVDFSEVRAYQEAGDWAASGRLLAEAGRHCVAGGADFVLICSNLMHKNAEDVAAAVGVPLLRITDAIVDRARAEGWSRAGLLGTRWVMEDDFYLGRLRSAGLEVLVPESADRAAVDRIIFDELTQGEVRETSRKEYLRVIDGMVADGAEGVILGCTEIELLVRPEDAGVPTLDSTRVHAEAAVTRALR
jgi:aspartate racemase